MVSLQLLTWDMEIHLKNGLTNLKRNNMDFALGYITAILIMSIVLRYNKKQLEKLKDFDTWKEWKNK